jgi:hypothetical protein
VFLGILAAFATFALVAALLQWAFGGRPEDPGAADRIKKHDEVAAEQSALLEKYGLSAGKSDATIAKVSQVIKIRAMGPSGVVVPGTPTAAKLAPPVPAAPAPATGAKPPAAPAPAPAPVPAPAPAPATPAAPPVVK